MDCNYKKIFYIVVIFIFVFSALPSLAEDLVLNENNNIAVNQPEFQITINDGQMATSNISAMLKFKFPVTVKSINISEYEDFRIFYTFSSRNFFVHTLSEEIGAKIVYARFLDENNKLLGTAKAGLELLKPEAVVIKKEETKIESKPEVKGVKIFKSEADRVVYLQKEAEILSSGNLSELLMLNGQKRELKIETATIKKYYGIIKSKFKLTNQQIFPVLNYISYSINSSIEADAQQRAEKIFSFAKKNKKMPTLKADWLKFLKSG